MPHPYSSEIVELRAAPSAARGSLLPHSGACAGAHGTRPGWCDLGNKRSFDAIIIGAGISGLYQLHHLRKLGMSVHVLEAADGLGGTWYWNRYPGCRFDSESYTYEYSLPTEIVGEWRWSERFASQPETLRYLETVADRLDLGRDIQYNARVDALNYVESEGRWAVRLSDGSSLSCQFLVTALGLLSAPLMPSIPGIGDFEGFSAHTGLWPHDPVDLRGKRVAVIGTGASGVQLITAIADVASELVVFQRRPNWCAPLRNGPILETEQAWIQANRDQIFEQCRETFAQFMHDADRRLATEVTDHERLDLYNRLYDEPGFGIWLSTFRDVLVDPAANATITDFIADRIRSRVHDRDVARRLIPTDHGFGTRRVPLESGYYEVYNKSHVRLVDLRDSPIVAIRSDGIETTDERLTFDSIIYATGFKPVTGAYERIEITGRDGVNLQDAWADGPLTYLGFQTPGFPNMFMVIGPQSAGPFCNIPRCIEFSVEWISRCLAFVRERGVATVEPLEAAAAEWSKEVATTASRMLFSRTGSWLTGHHSHSQDDAPERVLVYAGGAPEYRRRCCEVADQGYIGFSLGSIDCS